MNLAGLLVVGEAVGDEVAEFFVQRVRGREAFTEDDEGAGNFSGGNIGFGDYAAVANGGVFEQERFDFSGGDGESFVLDHLFAAVEDVVITVGVRTYDVAGEVPAVAKNGGGGLRVVPVSEHNLRAAHDEFAWFAGSDFVPVQIQNAAFGEGQRLSDGGGSVHFRGSDAADVGDR